MAELNSQTRIQLSLVLGAVSLAFFTGLRLQALESRALAIETKSAERGEAMKTMSEGMGLIVDRLARIESNTEWMRAILEQRERLEGRPRKR